MLVELGTYATLLNQKIIIPSAKGNYVAVERHFLNECLAQTIKRIKFDEHWYLSTYPDVREAIASGTVSNAPTHYARFGYYEHRMPYRITVDEGWYVSEYPDVKAALAKQHFASGQAHFDADGFREGRIPYPNFKLDLAS
jgi:hypothetical protein